LVVGLLAFARHLSASARSKQPLDAQCRWPPKIAATAPLRDTVGPAKAALSIQADREAAQSGQPDAGATINITINIGRTE